MAQRSQTRQQDSCTTKHLIRDLAIAHVLRSLAITQPAPSGELAAVHAEVQQLNRCCWRVEVWLHPHLYWRVVVYEDDLGVLRVA